MVIYLYEFVKRNGGSEIAESMKKKKKFMGYFENSLTFALFAQAWILRVNSSVMIFASKTSLIFDTIDEQQQ